MGSEMCIRDSCYSDYAEVTMRQSLVVDVVVTWTFGRRDGNELLGSSLGDVGLLRGEVLLLDFRAAAIYDNGATPDRP